MPLIRISPASTEPWTNPIDLRKLTRILCINKTRQGYARKRTLKPAGYFFSRGGA